MAGYRLDDTLYVYIYDIEFYLKMNLILWSELVNTVADNIIQWKLGIVCKQTIKHKN